MSTAVINLKWERWSWWTFQKPHCCIPAPVKWSCRMHSAYLSLYLQRNWSFVGICWESRGTPFKSLGKFQAWNLLQKIKAHSRYIVMTFTNSWPKFPSMKSLNIILIDRHKHYSGVQGARWWDDHLEKLSLESVWKRPHFQKILIRWQAICLSPAYHRLTSFRPAVGESYHTWRQNQTLT